MYISESIRMCIILICYTYMLEKSPLSIQNMGKHERSVSMKLSDKTSST